MTSGLRLSEGKVPHVWLVSSFGCLCAAFPQELQAGEQSLFAPSLPQQARLLH